MDTPRLGENAFIFGFKGPVCLLWFLCIRLCIHGHIAIHTHEYTHAHTWFLKRGGRLSRRVFSLDLRMSHFIPV